MSINDGLPDNSVKCIYEDVDGFIWLGTKNGLARYDGVRMQTFKTVPDDNYSLPDNFVYSISQLEDKSLVIGGANLSVSILTSDLKFNRSIGETLSLVCKSHVAVSKVVQDKNGFLWVATFGNGLFVFSIDGTLQRQYTSKIYDAKGISSLKVSDLLVDDSLIYVANESNYIDVIDINDFSVKHFRATKSIMPFQSFGSRLCRSADGGVWYSTERQGVYRFYPDDFKFAEFTWLGQSFSAIISDIAVYNDSTLLVAYDGAGLSQVNIYTHESAKYVNNPLFKQSLPGNALWSLHVTKQDAVWVGLFAKGMASSTRESRRMRVYSNKTSKGAMLAENSILSIFPFDRSHCLFSTDGGGMYLLNYSNYDVTPFERGKDGLKVVKTISSINGNVVCGTYGKGLQFLDYVNDQSLLKLKDTLKDRSVWSITADSSKSIWVGTLYDGLYHYSDSLRVYKDDGKEDLPANMINALACDSYGTVWVGTEGGGAVFYSKGGFYTYAGVKPSKKVVYDIATVSDGNVWIGYKNGGIDIVHNDNEQYVLKKSLLEMENSVLSIFALDSLVCITTERSVILYTLSGDVVKEWSFVDGIVSEGFNNNSLLCLNSKIYAGGVSGLNEIETYVNNSEIVYPPQVERVQFIRNGKQFFAESNDWVYESNDTIHLSYSDLTLSIFLVKPSKGVVANSYEYRVKGLVQDWNNVSNMTLNFPYIKGGVYELELRSVSNQQKSKTNVVVLNVELPLWKKKWFVALVVVILIVFLFSIYAYRDYTHKKYEAKLKKDVLERTTFIREQNSKLEESSKELISKNNLLYEQKVTLEAHRYELEQVNETLLVQREEISRQAEKIGEKNKLLTKSLNYAKRIQDSLFPSSKQFETVLPNSFLFFRPKEIVSGDFFWLQQVDECIVVAEVDCTGHGVPGAFMSMIGNALLNEIVTNKKIVNPAEIFYLMNEELMRIFSLGDFDAEAQDDGMDLSIAVLKPKEKTVSIASAMQSIFVVDGNGVKIHTGDIFSIGGLMARFKSPVYTSDDISIEDGKMIVLSSDGFIDQFGGESREKYGVDRFVDLLKKVYADRSNKETLNCRVKNEFEGWVGNKNQLDDVLIAGFWF